MTKIDIISGFLGAGKTTLLKKLIGEAFVGEKLVLIENEFGEIAVDGGFLQDAGITITEMNSGCICCSLVGDFQTALQQVLDTYSPDRILIEPSGVGKLSDVITAVSHMCTDTVVLNSATTVVDATKARLYSRNFGEFFHNQIQNACCVILSRTQNLSEQKLGVAKVIVRNQNPDATLITTPWEQLSGKEILSAMEQEDTLQTELSALVETVEESGVCPDCGEHHDHHEHHHHDHEHGESCSCGHDHHHHDHDHEHHHHHADEVFQSLGSETTHPYSKEDLEALLEGLGDKGKFGNVLRAKGFVPSQGETWLYFDYTPGEYEVREGKPAVTGRICIIGAKLNEEAIKEWMHLG